MTIRYLDMAQFYDRAQAFDAMVAKTPGIDTFCSSTAWILSAYEAFSPEYETWLMESEHGFVALVQSHHERLGQFRQPLEASWCLASPFVGEDTNALVQDFMQASLTGERNWDLLFLSGLERDGALYNSLIERFSGMFFVGVGPPVVRFVASLDGGVEGFLSRRASKFRANLRRLDRRATDANFEKTYISSAQGPLPWEAIYDRILAIETNSWKGQSGTGILDAPMQLFYKKMLPRLNQTGMLRVLFITKDGEDVAFVFGGVFCNRYRGLQISFNNDYRSFSPGNLAQYWMIQHLIEEGVEAYDLGSELEYKRRWAEQRHETVSLVIRSW